MTLWAIVPVKPLRRGKSRLADVLTPEERADLNSRLLAHTLETLTAVPEIEQVLVVSRDPGALALAREYGARTVMEHGSPELNVALTRATIVAQKSGTGGVLVIPADLPLITPEDIQALIQRAVDPPVIVIAPDRRREGTNALLVDPAGLIDYQFGPGSFEIHCRRAEQTAARLEIFDLPSLALDVDYPEDLELVSDELDDMEMNQLLFKSLEI